MITVIDVLNSVSNASGLIVHDIVRKRRGYRAEFDKYLTAKQVVIMLCKNMLGMDYDGIAKVLCCERKTIRHYYLERMKSKEVLTIYEGAITLLLAQRNSAASRTDN